MGRFLAVAIVWAPGVAAADTAMTSFWRANPLILLAVVAVVIIVGIMIAKGQQ